MDIPDHGGSLVPHAFHLKMAVSSLGTCPISTILAQVCLMDLALLSRRTFSCALLFVCLLPLRQLVLVRLLLLQHLFLLKNPGALWIGLSSPFLHLLIAMCPVLCVPHLRSNTAFIDLTFCFVAIGTSFACSFSKERMG
jgi:hypothetical protein